MLWLIANILWHNTKKQCVWPLGPKKTLATEEYINTVLDDISTNNTSKPVQIDHNLKMAIFIDGEYTT